MIHRLQTLFIISFLAICFLFACGKKEGRQAADSEISDTNQTEQPSPYAETTNPVDSQPLPPLNGVRSIKVNNIGALATVFNDTNDLHLREALNLGIEPIEKLSMAYNTRRPLVKISSNELYHIDSLRHSLPYLVPEAAQLLAEIGRNFNDSLKKRGGDSYIIKVTSLLRTPETVKKLKKVNVNAAENSAHEYGTTFDISWSNFYCLNERRQINQGDLKNLLAEVLLDLRSQGKCYVKFEKKTACFHVSARK